MFDEVKRIAGNTSLSPETVEKAQELWRKTSSAGIKHGRASVCLYLAAEM
jgi:transcription initiation factor TFIIIB Brf1 subunit/transcription initiation factor TFIIB